MNTPNGAADLLSQENHTAPPLQLPKVGWDDDEDDDTALDPPAIQSIPPSSTHSSVTLRPSRQSELELQPIPEDMSMHGPWPDFCIYDYDVDRKKAYRYRICGRLTFKSGFFTVLCLAVLSIGVVHIPPRHLEDGSDEKLTQDQSHLYESVAMTFHPLWYDRTRGWNGTAYLQSYEFCSKVEARGEMVPCPWVAYCPLGKGYAPYGGQREGWAPVSDRENEWVQLGPSQTCELYSDINTETPRWGLTGENDEELTRNIMCCLKEESFQLPESTLSMKHDSTPMSDEDAVDSDYLHRPPSLEEVEQDKESTLEDVQSPTNTEGSTNEQNQQILNQLANMSSNKGSTNQSPTKDSQSAPIEDSQLSLEHQKLLLWFEPLWFDSAYGWSGTDLSEAQEFCHSKAGRRSLCPFIAYCPEGPSRKVFEGHNTDAKIEWAPMEEWNGYQWVGIGTNNSCSLAKDVGEFEIGEGDSVGDFVGNIMCCKDKMPELDGD